jgi:prepilin-type N-terminal cleavage/methylation domain-containing protein
MKRTDNSPTIPPRAFTLVELLVAIAVIGILAALLLPALARSKENALRATCLNNQKQLDLAWQMYADQSGGSLALNDWEYRVGVVVQSPSNSWVTGNAALDPDPATITNGTLYPYVKSTTVYRCPTDNSMILGASSPTWRSYSLSCFMGGPPEDNEWNVTPLRKLSQIQNTSACLTFLEEDISTIDDGHFLYSPAITNWINVPAWRHQNGDVLAFADGHLEYWKWRGALPASTYLAGGPDLTNAAALADLNRLQKTAPIAP